MRRMASGREHRCTCSYAAHPVSRVEVEGGGGGWRGVEGGGGRWREWRSGRGHRCVGLRGAIVGSIFLPLLLPFH